MLSLDFLICLKKGKIEGEQIGEKNAMNVIETFKNKKVLVLKQFYKSQNSWL